MITINSKKKLKHYEKFYKKEKAWYYRMTELYGKDFTSSYKARETRDALMYARMAIRRYKISLNKSEINKK